MVDNRRRRRLRRADRSFRQPRDVLRIAGRPNEPCRPRDQRTQNDPPRTARRREALPLELGYADADLAAQPRDYLRLRQPRPEIYRSRTLVEGDQPRSDRQY